MKIMIVITSIGYYYKNLRDNTCKIVSIQPTCKLIISIADTSQTCTTFKGNDILEIHIVWYD